MIRSKGQSSDKQRPVESSKVYVANRILVIDDQEIVRTFMEDILAPAGYEVILASNGEEGLRLFRKKNPALVITDMIMPGKLGDEVILEILRESPSAKFIAMSDGGELGPEVSLSIAETINIHTVPKPFEPEIILKAVRKLIGPPGTTT